jgi:hypothetical protein
MFLAFPYFEDAARNLFLLPYSILTKTAPLISNGVNLLIKKALLKAPEPEPGFLYQ